MFFSTDKNNLPRIDELICIRGDSSHERPYRVVDRMINKENHQAYVDLVDITTSQQMPRCKVEPFSFWPMTGDTVLIVMGPYLDWLAEQLKIAQDSHKRNRIKQIEARFKACEVASKTTEELLQKHVIELTEGAGLDAMAAVRNESNRLFKCPVKCLAVLEKKDRRTDSRSAQKQQLNLLEVS